MAKSNAQEALDTLVKGFRNKSGKSDPKWESKLSPTEKKRLASARKLAKATEGKKVSLGQRTSEGLLPDLPRGKTGTKREVAEKKYLEEQKLIKDMIAKGKEKPLATRKQTKKEIDTLQEDIKTIRKLKLPLKEVTVGTAKFQKKAAEPGEPLSAAHKESIRLDKKAQQLAAKMDAQAAAEKKRLAELDRKKAAANKPEKADSSTEDTSWKKGHDPVTKFMEELLGTKRTVAQVKKDMDASKTSEDEMLEFYGKKRGGKVTAKRPSTKKYAMNRGGKVASVRKPTRA